MLNYDEDFDPKFGQVSPKEAMHSSDSDSMKTNPSDYSFNFGPSTFDPRITTTNTTIPIAVVDHQSPLHVPSLMELLQVLFVSFLPLLQPLFALLLHLIILLLIISILRLRF